MLRELLHLFIKFIDCIHNVFLRLLKMTWWCACTPWMIVKGTTSFIVDKSKFLLKNANVRYGFFGGLGFWAAYFIFDTLRVLLWN